MPVTTEFGYMYLYVCMYLYMYLYLFVFMSICVSFYEFARVLCFKCIFKTRFQSLKYTPVCTVDRSQSFFLYCAFDGY